MATGVLKQSSRMDTSISMVIQLLFLIFVCYGPQLANGCLDNTTTLEDGFTGQLKFCTGSWGAVCSLARDEFTQVDSQVVCYELGYSGDGANPKKGNNNIPHNYIALARVHCRGDEERLSECPKHGGDIYECEYTDESVYVTCPKESQVRLHNYQDSELRDYRGVVEHYYNSNWHILCDTGEWTLNDSQVMCHQLGLGEAVKPGFKYKGKLGSLDYLQNNITCRNSENMIRNCRVENQWNTTSTCDGTVVNVMCQGPVVQNITITSLTSESVTFSWNLPPNFYYYNADVVRKFRVKFWPEGHHEHQERYFHRSSNFSNATLEFLTPDTTYEMVIISMMGDHSGPDSKKLSVKTGKSPVIVGLSCGLAVSCIIIAVLFGVIITILSCYIKRRLRHGVPWAQAAADGGNDNNLNANENHPLLDNNDNGNNQPQGRIDDVGQLRHGVHQPAVGGGNVNNPNADENRPLLDNNGDGNNQPEGLERSGVFYDAINHMLNIQGGNNGGGHQEVI